MTTSDSSAAKKYWDKDWGENWQDKSWPPSEFAEKAYSIIKNKGLKDILDIGSGKGRDSLFFAEKGLGVTAVDISDIALKMIQEKNPRIKCFSGDITEIEFPDNSFDVIYGHLILHYFNHADLANIIKKIHRILRRDGYVFIKCKSVEDPLFGKGKKIEKNVYFHEHLRNFFTKEYMRKILKDFDIIEVNQIKMKEQQIGYKYRAAFIEGIAKKKSLSLI